MRGTSRPLGLLVALLAAVATVPVGLAGGGQPAYALDSTTTTSTTGDGSSSEPAVSDGAQPTVGPGSESRTTRQRARERQEREREAAAKAKAKAKAKAAVTAERKRAEAKAAARATAEAKAEAAAERAEEAAHDAAELVAASAALASAEADLGVAREKLTDAREQVTAARQALAGAQTDLDAAVLAEERASRELTDVETRILSRQEDLGRLARTAYQSNGGMGEWSLVLSSGSTNELTERLSFLQSISSASNAVIADLAVDRADLIAAQDRLSAARELAEFRARAAQMALEGVSQKEDLARAAAQQVDAVVKVRQAAVEAARKAAVEDRRRYQVLLVQSGALGSRIQELAARLGKGKAANGTGRFVLPGTGEVTSEYGPRLHPILDYVKVHTGTDFGAGDGVVYAADDGVVLLTEYNVAYGNMTVVDHGRVGGLRISTLYAHQAAAGVQPGDRVLRGQAIGVVGSTGFSTGPHLHFEVRVDGEPLDPGPFLEKSPAPTGAGRSR